MDKRQAGDYSLFLPVFLVQKDIKMQEHSVLLYICVSSMESFIDTNNEKIISCGMMRAGDENLIVVA